MNGLVRSFELQVAGCSVVLPIPPTMPIEEVVEILIESQQYPFLKDYSYDVIDESTIRVNVDEAYWRKYFKRSSRGSVEGGVTIALDYELAEELEYLIIPREFEGSPVVAFGDGIYEFDVKVESKIKKVFLPHTVKVINYGAFSKLNIEHVYLNEGLEVIGKNAFIKNNLLSLSIPHTVKVIETNAFRINNISQLKLGNSLETIGESAFRDNRIGEVVIPDSVCDMDEYAFSSNKISKVVLGNSLESVGWEVFSKNMIEEVVFSDSVKVIENYAFWDNQLENVEIPGTVKELRVAAFLNNPIQHLKLNEGVEKVGSNCFENCNIEAVVLPDSLEVMNANAFAYNQIQSIEIGKGLEHLENSVFANNKTLKHVVIPKNVKMLGEGIFRSTKLSKCIIEGPVEFVGDYDFIQEALFGHRFFAPTRAEVILNGEVIIIP